MKQAIQMLNEFVDYIAQDTLTQELSNGPGTYEQKRINWLPIPDWVA